MTKGEEIVRVNFNSEALDTVTQIKSLSAKLIDLIEKLDSNTNPAECLRLKTQATLNVEIASMFAVKAATIK
jgi:hypothetical protein